MTIYILRNKFCLLYKDFPEDMYNTIQKTIAAWAFNHYIAYYYFDNVNVSQLKVAFEKGEVELEDLPIKKDALKHFNLPLDVLSGIVGKISIKVPLLTLLTDPWIIKISNLMLIVAPKKHPQNGSSTATSSTPTPLVKRKSAQANSKVSQPDDGKEKSAADSVKENAAEQRDSTLTDCLDASSFIESSDSDITTEETKLAEFYSSFSTTVSAIVRDIYKNIRLEIESMTVLFEDFDQGLMKFSIGNFLLHRPKSVRNILMEDVSVYISSAGIPSVHRGDDLVRLYLERCVLDIHDEASKSMQIVAVQPDPVTKRKDAQDLCKSSATISEIRIDGTLSRVNIERLTGMSRHSMNRDNFSSIAQANRPLNDNKLTKRDILKCNSIKIEFKYSINQDGDIESELSEKNLHLKMDMGGLQYIHSQRIYEITMQRLMNLLKLFRKLSNTGRTDRSGMRKNNEVSASNQNVLGNSEKSSLNKLLNINIEEGLLYVVDDVSGSCAIPLLEFSLEDLRIFQFSEKHEQNGFVYAKIGCNYYNREKSSWDPLLQAWPFNVSWDLKAASTGNDLSKRYQCRKVSISSDELAEISLSSGLLDLGDIALRRIINDVIYPKLWPVNTKLNANSQLLSTYFNSIFVLHNETGHKLFFAPVEHNREIFEVRDITRSSTIDEAGDDLVQSTSRKLSTHSRSTNDSRDSPELVCVTKWSSVEAGEVAYFEFESLPIYRRQVSELNNYPRVLMLRVEGWKTLYPIPIDKTGLFFRKACADRVINVDTDLVVSIDLEQTTARKIVSIRSPLNLVNRTDVTLEIHFAESNQALYIKPGAHLPVPLPVLFNTMHIRPCNVGVTMSEQTLLWDDIQNTFDQESKIHICNPLTNTDQRHSSYCSSQPYRICVSTKREGSESSELYTDGLLCEPAKVYTLSFLPPLTIVNLLPFKLDYEVEGCEGTINRGTHQKIYKVDTTKPVDINFKTVAFPRSKAISIDPGATGSFHHTLEMFDTKNRSLFLDANVVIASCGNEPAVQVIIYAPFWFINKTDTPIVIKQEGAALEAAGQFSEHENSVCPILLFSFYELELEPPWLCSLRLGKSKGSPAWCEGFKLEKGSGERRLTTVPKSLSADQRMNKVLIDINIRKGFGCFSVSTIVTLTKRYGFDPLTKTPKKSSLPSPQNYNLASYNHSTNLAGRIAGQAINLFNSNCGKKVMSDLSLKAPGLRLALYDNQREKFAEACVREIDLRCSTNMKAREQILNCTVQDVRIFNLLPDCEKCVMLDRSSNPDQSIANKPAVHLIMDRVLGSSYGSAFFKQVQLSMCDLVLNIEEKLVLKFIEFISFRNRRRTNNMDNLNHDLNKILDPEEDRRSKYYFDLLRIDLSGLKLSVFTSYNLTGSLQRLKTYLGLKFFGFEDAHVELAAYTKMHVSKTFRGVFESVTRFYKQQIFEQAPRIVGQQIQNYLRFHLSDLLSTLYDEVYNKLFN